VIILDSLLIGGIRFVLSRIAEAVDAEMNDERAVREELLAAQMQLELGELGEAEFRQLEAALLGRLREIRERERAAGGEPEPGDLKTRVEVVLDDDDQQRS
jgi:Gas vesicle protein G